MAFFLPRGIRNNNPGNLRLGKDRWQGQKDVQNDLSFVEFTEAVFGLRALMKTLLTYHVKYGLNTVETIINRYAPPHENATDHYIYSVARAIGVRRRDKISLTDERLLTALTRAIVCHENGRPATGYPEGWYAPEIYAAAFRSL